MTRPSLLVSLRTAEHPEDRDGNPIFLRDTILQSQTTLRIEGWNKGNLLRSIAYRNRQTFSLIVLDVDGLFNGDLLIHLGTRETLTLSKVMEAHLSRNVPLTIFLLNCKIEEIDEVQKIIAGWSVSNTMFLITAGDKHCFYFALACELTHWWDLESCLSETITFEDISRCIANIATAYSNTGASDCKFAIVRRASISNETAWRGGFNYAPMVDIEKFRQGARGEQLDDTLKRMSDAANYPRQQHSSTEERMISSQGLFWLAEVSPLDQMSTWLRDTRLFRECHPYASELVPLVVVRELREPTVSFFRDFQDHFVSVPAGVYQFGSNDESLESEPPASPAMLSVPGFRILRYPVTYGFLRAFMHCDVSTEMDSLPVTNVSYFDAEYIASKCTSFLHSYGLPSLRNYKVRLPTEYQWEAAARGPEGRNFPWGALFDGRLANYGMCIGHPTPPGMFSPSGDSLFGCQDMAGNVREWTRSYGGTRGIDWSIHSQHRVQGDGRRILDVSRMVIRGGSYSYSSDCLQSWVRNTQIANRRDSQTGFRFVLEE